MLFTDGVSEAADARGEMLGEERLEQLVAANRTRGARDLQQALVDAVTELGGSELQDDLTLVVVAL